MLLRRVIEHVKAQNWTAVALDFVIVVVGVFMGIQVSNWNDARSERVLSNDYLLAFQRDLSADSKMLQIEIEARKLQLENALAVLEYFEGESLDVSAFFEAYYAVLYARSTSPNRNTMDELLNSGSLRLIRNSQTRTGLLDLYSTYELIASHEEHIARDFDMYLYDPTFSSIPVQIEGPWADNMENRASAEALLNNVTIENGFRLIVLNLQYGDNQGLIADLEAASMLVDKLLQELP